MKSFKILFGLIFILMLMCLNVSFAQTPIADYSFDVDASDATGNFNGTLEGDAAIVDDADRGKVLQLTSDGYVSLPTELADAMNEDFSFTVWVAFAGDQSYAGIMGMGMELLNNAPYWDVHLRPDGKISYYSSDGPVWPGSGDCKVTPEDGYNLLDDDIWVHLAFSFTKGTGASLYANAEIKELEVWNDGYPNEGGVSPGDIGAEVVQIGKDAFNQRTLTNTKIDEYKFFDKALTAEEINTIYTGASAIEDNSLPVPMKYELAQNYPNPFNPSTSIEYTLAKNTQVEIVVYDLLGHKVATLMDGYQNSGTHKVVWEASGVSAGIYLYQIQTEDFIQSKKMILLK